MTRRTCLAVAWLLMPAAPVLAQAAALVDTFDAAWRIVRDSHFDPGMNGVDWDAVRKELRPHAIEAGSPGELRAVIREMLGRLGQSHFALLPASADSPKAAAIDGSGHPGFDVRLSGREIVVTSVDSAGPASEAGIRAGWRLLSVDGVAVSDVLDHLAADLPARLMSVEAWRAVEGRLHGPDGSSAALSFDNGRGAQVTVAVVRRQEPGELVTIGNLPTMRVHVETARRRTPGGASAGVIGFNVWMPAVDAEFARFVDDFRSADGIVIDLRGNPGGLAAMLMGISGQFLTERKALGVMKTRDTTLSFVANPRLVNAAGVRVQPFAGPVAIIVDEMSGSATECFAGGMQSIGRARIFGRTSMGQALPALFDSLPNGDVLIHAYGDFVTADGTRLEGRGVIPDEPVALRREELLAGRDAPLDAALAWIDRRSRAGGAEHR